MKRTLFIIALLVTPFIMQSCSLFQRTIDRVEYRDSIIIHEKEVLRDTTVYVHLPGETFYDSIPVLIPCPDIPSEHPAVYPNRLTVQGSLAYAHSWIHNQQLHLLLTEKDTLLPVKLNNAIREREYWRNRYQSKEEVKVIQLPWWKNMFYYIGLFTSLLFIIFLLLRFLPFPRR